MDTHVVLQRATCQGTSKLCMHVLDSDIALLRAGTNSQACPNVSPVILTMTLFIECCKRKLEATAKSMKKGLVKYILTG